MQFLKSFYAFGFKSFANEVKIDFKDDMTGIVGPNGAGKSNIVDAFKWVLGEQSIKDMRGNSRLDLIFRGSTSQPEAKFAQVTLTFDNSKKVLHYDKDEISITRKLYRDSGNNEYYINNEPAKLKDIQMIFTDTGLSKGSLGIISQGTINTFTESKPEGRIKMFQEAAGIGMYSMQKTESLRHLERSEQALEAILTVEKELEKDLKKLSKQAESAKIYKEKFDRLKDLDVSILVKDITHFSNTKTKLEADIEKYKSQKFNLEPIVNETKTKLDFIKQKFQEADELVNESNKELFDIKEKISQLEKKQLLFNNKVEQDLESDDLETKLNAYQQLIVTHQKDIANYKERIEEATSSIETYTEIHNNLESKKTQTMDIINGSQVKLAEINTQLRMINEQIQRNANKSIGVKSILENKSALKGVYDVVGKFIEVDEKYEVAIAKALGNSINNIIVETSENAKHAVHFLKQNNAGQATFLPLKDIKTRYVKEEHLDVLTELEGFVGIASKLINVDPKMQPVIDALIGQVIIAGTIDDAIRISKYTYQLYKVIALDGDQVFPGGAITGGSERAAPTFNLEKHKEELEEQLQKAQENLSSNRIEYDRIASEFQDVTVKLNEKNFSLQTLKTRLEESSKNYDKYKMEYEVLSKKSFDSKVIVDENKIQDEINSLTAQKDKIFEEVNIAVASKTKYNLEVQDSEGKLEELRLELDKVRNDLSSMEQDLIRCNNAYDNSKNRINENYGMTLEYATENYSKELPMSEAQAREIINTLRGEIDALGTINPKAVEELTEKQEKFTQITENKRQSEEAIANIKQSIAELDRAAKAKYAKVISDVNAALPEIFKFLFGGGTCAINFSDPENILESGIEVMAHPPGKKVSNLNLLSGGEKTLVAISVLFAILKTSSFPMVILDEAEAALDIANVDRFAQIIRQYSEYTQFLVITHRPGTMKQCPTLLGATMQTPGVTELFSVALENAIKFSEEDK